MKKIITLVLALCMALTTLVACGNTTAKTAKVIDIELTSEQYAFGVDKNQPELLTKVNEFIKKIKEDGTLTAIDFVKQNGTPSYYDGKYFQVGNKITIAVEDKF